MFRFISYLKFLLESKNQHGVHSPFVFDFVTKGLYQKLPKNMGLSQYERLELLSKKEQKILSKTINYFKIDAIHTEIKTDLKTQEKKHRLLYISNINNINSILNDELVSNYFIVIHNIHKNKQTQQKWLKIIQKNNATVTIDLFYFGLIFFRVSQAKEHFIIRV
ncbi:hypothetical protein [Polaribacter porphyrae]|uniref:Uncharacterized protein n=1 Tax=Polaribacter porphyrae TaxID=1137780 RepID=A0A2S7WKV0_9FLAO|nr:hypothetical protein [Polaribacter porphyrae]PQJ77922.1 hypothetical protein BTO18_01405 [Polaribacter porphyrae]